MQCLRNAIWQNTLKWGLSVLIWTGFHNFLLMKLKNNNNYFLKHRSTENKEILFKEYFTWFKVSIPYLQDWLWVLLMLICSDSLHISSLKMPIAPDWYGQVLISIYKHILSINHIHCMVGTDRTLWESSPESLDKWVKISYYYQLFDSPVVSELPSGNTLLLTHHFLSTSLFLVRNIYIPWIACSFHASCPGIKSALSIRNPNFFCWRMLFRR